MDSQTTVNLPVNTVSIFFMQSLPKDFKFMDVAKKYQLGLCAVELGHLAGSVKYKPFSWYNCPEKSDSLPINNVNAMMRHLTSLETGRVYDMDSGLPHVVHLACRAGMLVSIVRKLQHAGVVYVPQMSHTVPDSPAFGGFLTGAEYLALYNADVYLANHSNIKINSIDIAINVLHELLPQSGGSFLKDHEFTNGGNFKDISNLVLCEELIFYTAIMLCTYWLARFPDSIQKRATLEHTNAAMEAYIGRYFSPETIRAKTIYYQN